MAHIVPKHDIHKFHDIRPKLERDNWVSWKRELLATARDRGLYAIITGTDKLLNEKDSNVTIASGVQHVGDVPLVGNMEGQEEGVFEGKERKGHTGGPEESGGAGGGKGAQGLGIGPTPRWSREELGNRV
jgi:hypothetical protein